MKENIQKAVEIIRNYQGDEIRIMEVCGTHTHEIFRSGIRQILPEKVHLISGPGCPVCVTPVGYIDQAISLALEHHCTICTFGDLIRVPGSHLSLQQARQQGASIEMIYSPLDAVSFAEKHPEQEIVLLAVGFETTTPLACKAILKAKEKNLKNFSVLSANKTMEQAYYALSDSADAFLYPGHVATITGCQIYRNLAKKDISGVVAGFTTSELIMAIAMILKKHKKGEAFFVNCYPRVVSEQGSLPARNLIETVMEACDSQWRGLGNIAQSGLRIKAEYASYDAYKKYHLKEELGQAHPLCRCGDVLKGKCLPKDCSVYGKGCTPEHPIGACMVSNEGACSAFYKYSIE